jgi:hypothetical protein
MIKGAVIQLDVATYGSVTTDMASAIFDDRLRYRVVECTKQHEHADARLKQRCAAAQIAVAVAIEAPAIPVPDKPHVLIVRDGEGNNLRGISRSLQKFPAVLYLGCDFRGQLNFPKIYTGLWVPQVAHAIFERNLTQNPNLVSSLQAHALIQNDTNTDYCLVTFCTRILTTSYSKRRETVP